MQEDALSALRGEYEGKLKVRRETEFKLQTNLENKAEA